jgi:hypothetical protein
MDTAILFEGISIFIRFLQFGHIKDATPFDGNFSAAIL